MRTSRAADRPLLSINATRTVPQPPSPRPAQAVPEPHVEAIDATHPVEARAGWPLVAVQWHPALDRSPSSTALVAWLVGR